MVLILKKKTAKTVKQQIDDLLKERKYTRKKRNWNSFFGKVDYSAKPVNYQRSLRDE